MMILKNSKKSTPNQSPSVMSTDDSITNLPDLSAFQDGEKQHILNVLLRDENLRQKHLARFWNLRKEVADLEQQSQSTSTSACARCQTPFGYIFNTGDACPKCAAIVCKQCRLMYNVNDNGWLCQLCCKQMQLMSYSGEWIYSLHNNLRKDSATPSDGLNGSLPPSASFQNIRAGSSSDSESEEMAPSLQKIDRFSGKPIPTKSKPNGPIDKMIVQNPADVQKLNFVKERIEDRPSNVSFTQPLPRRTHRTLLPSNTINSSSDENNSLMNQKKDAQDHVVNKHNRPTSNHGKGLKRNGKDIDIESNISSQKVTDNKLAKHTLKVKQHSQSSPRDSKLSLTSITAMSTTSSRKYLSASMQSLRGAVHRISHPHIASSHISLNAEKNRQVNMSVSATINDEDATSLKVPSRTNSRITLQTPQLSVDEPKQSSSKTHRLESANTIDSTNTTDLQSTQRNVSETDSENKSTSLGNRQSVADSEDDIDRKFENAKSTPAKRASSYMDVRGSQLSINSTVSETKARYEREVTGTIQLKLSYNMKTGALDIFIKKCTNLAHSKRQQISNPYCKAYLLPDKSKGSKRKTTVRKQTTDPVFNETLHYHVSLQEFDTRIVWISVWTQASLAHNDFLGEVNIPLANCILDNLREYTLQSQIQEENANAEMESTVDTSELYFELTFIGHPKNKDIGTIQVNAIHGTGIRYGKHSVNAICKGFLLPEKSKRKLPTVRKGPSPKWDIPLRWENIRREKLKDTSIEISLWNQERFRKTMIGFVRLNSIRKCPKNLSIKMIAVTSAERFAWELFEEKPTKIHRLKLPLRPATHEQN